MTEGYRRFILERKKAYQKIPFIYRVEYCLNIRAQQIIPLNVIGRELKELRIVFNEEEFETWEKIIDEESGWWIEEGFKTRDDEVNIPSDLCEGLE